MLMIDIDYFKRVNDTFGHMVGDDILRETAHRVRACLSLVDLAALPGVIPDSWKENSVASFKIANLAVRQAYFQPN
jgi:hypothetical protein